MRQLSYLITIFIFCGIALLIMYKRRGDMLKKNWGLLLFMTLLGIPLAVMDYFAIEWGAWAYGTAATLHFRLAGELETYLFSAGVFAAVAAATIIWAEKTDIANSSKKRATTSKTKKA